MRILVLGSILTFLAGGILVAGQREPTEPFPEFFARFAHDETFRVSRITFPLRAILGNPTDPRIRQKWSRAQLIEEFTVPVAGDRLQVEGLEQEIATPSASETEVTQSHPESDSYILIYRFKLKKGQWFLVEFEDSSY